MFYNDCKKKVCIMKILSITGQNFSKNGLSSGFDYLEAKPEDKPQSFKGLTKSLKNKIYLDGQKDIELLLKRKPKTNPVVGQLPNFIFKKLPIDGKREAILDILGVFDKVSNIIREYEPKGDAFIFNPSLRYRPESVNQMLTDVFRKYGILSNWDDDIDVKYLDQGGKGKVFKIDGLRDFEKEDEFVIKVFHQIKGKNWHPFKSHGCYAEINNGIYWKNHEGHDTHRGKFFFGSLGSGYMVSKYIDEDVRIPQRVVPEYKYGIKCTDEAKEGPINGYNRMKGYNYDYGGMRVVNRLKNSNKIARQTLERMKNSKPTDRAAIWEQYFVDRSKSDDVKAGLALSIKYLPNKASYVERCMKLKNPKVNQALAYVLKYMPHEEAVKYFEKLFQTTDEVTQIILFNEIPLLAKRKAGTLELQDDINTALKEIIPERVYTFYMIAEKYAMPSTVEHLASFVDLLPENKVKQQYRKITNIQNSALQERLLWKFGQLSEEMKPYALVRLSEKTLDPELQEDILKKAEFFSEELYQTVLKNIEENKQKQN